MAEVIKQEI